MATPAAELQRAQGLTQPLRLTEGITQGELAQILNQSAHEAHALVGRNLLKAGAGAEMRAKQMQAAMTGMGSLSNSMWGKIGALTQAGIYDAASLSVDQALDRDFLLGMPFKAIQMYEEEMFFNAYQSAEDIISRRTNGFKLSDRIYRNGQATVMQVGQIVEQGLALQMSAKEIADRVRGHFSPNVPGGSSYAAQRLARTEINNAHHDTTIRMTKDQPWVLGYKWNLSGSHPKPDICNEYADEDHDNLGPGVFKKGNVPSKPHPMCLCYVSMVQPSRKDFTDSLVKGDYDDHLSGLGVHC